MLILIIFLLLIASVPNSQAEDCTTDKVTGDVTCVDGNVTYVKPSDATLAQRAQVQEQMDVDAQSELQAEVLIQENMKALAIQDLADKGIITVDQATAQTAQLSDLNTATAQSSKAQTATPSP